MLKSISFEWGQNRVVRWNSQVVLISLAGASISWNLPGQEVQEALQDQRMLKSFWICQKIWSMGRRIGESQDISRSTRNHDCALQSGVTSIHSALWFQAWADTLGIIRERGKGHSIGQCQFWRKASMARPSGRSSKRRTSSTGWLGETQTDLCRINPIESGEYGR